MLLARPIVRRVVFILFSLEVLGLEANGHDAEQVPVDVSALQLLRDRAHMDAALQ